MTIGKQHFSIYEVVIHKLRQFIGTLDILNRGHLPISLISLTQLTHMLHHVKAALQKTNTFHDLYSFKVVSFGYDKDFNLLLHFPVFF